MQSKNASVEGAGNGNNVSASISMQRLLDLVGKVIAPTTIVTALLFYFGWAQTNALFLHFGIDQSMLRLSTSDYVMRSIVVAFEPLRWILLLGLVGPWIHFAMRRLLLEYPSARRARLARLLVKGVLTMGLLALLAGPAGALLDTRKRLHPLFYPIAWTLAVGLTSYGVYLSVLLRRETLKKKASSIGLTASPEMYRTTWLFAAALVIFGLFWAVAHYADEVGRWSARQLIGHLADRPSVIVYSQNPLSLEYEGVEETEVNVVEKAYRYRYSGLKFLIHSDKKFFLLPERWSASNPVTIILPENDTIRVEVLPDSSSMP